TRRSPPAARASATMASTSAGSAGPSPSHPRWQWSSIRRTVTTAHASGTPPRRSAVGPCPRRWSATTAAVADAGAIRLLGPVRLVTGTGDEVGFRGHAARLLAWLALGPRRAWAAAEL